MDQTLPDSAAVAVADPPAPDREKLGDEIFRLLKSRGPLCTSQLSTELGVSIRILTEALEDLERERLVEQRRDRDRSRDYDAIEIPWGVRRPFHSRNP